VEGFELGGVEGEVFGALADEEGVELFDLGLDGS